jgi:osmoprotectant transport system ATP-binding protein
MIEFENVSKSFHSARVLRNISFRVDEGVTCALLGLSGSGKTTALKIIAGLHTYDSGRVSVGGIPVQESTLPEIRSQLGYVIQDGGLFPHLTAEKNLELVGHEAGWDAVKMRARINELSELTKMSKALLQKYPRELSGGQRQRVGLMRALMKNPSVLLLDEPLGALDPITRRDLQIELRALCRELKKTVVLVTHDLYDAGYLADHIFLLKDGAIVQEGRLQDLVQTPADEFVRKFVESQIHSDGT